MFQRNSPSDAPGFDSVCVLRFPKTASLYAKEKEETILAEEWTLKRIVTMAVCQNRNIRPCLVIVAEKDRLLQLL